LDVGLSHDATVCAVLHVGPGQELNLHALQTWQGNRDKRVSLDAVEEWLKGASQRYSAFRLVADPWQAVGLLQRLQNAGIRCSDVSFTSAYRGRIFGALLDVIRGERLRCPPHATLKDELLRLAFRDVGGVLRVDHPSGGHDDHAVSLAMAVLAAAERPAPRVEFF
jgi:hypothetical protein